MGEIRYKVGNHLSSKDGYSKKELEYIIPHENDLRRSEEYNKGAEKVRKYIVSHGKDYTFALWYRDPPKNTIPILNSIGGYKKISDSFTWEKLIGWVMETKDKHHLYDKVTYDPTGYELNRDEVYVDSDPYYVLDISRSKIVKEKIYTYCFCFETKEKSEEFRKSINHLEKYQLGYETYKKNGSLRLKNSALVCKIFNYFSLFAALLTAVCVGIPSTYNVGDTASLIFRCVSYPAFIILIISIIISLITASKVKRIKPINSSPHRFRMIFMGLYTLAIIGMIFKESVTFFPNFFNEYGITHIFLTIATVFANIAMYGIVVIYLFTLLVGKTYYIGNIVDGIKEYDALMDEFDASGGVETYDKKLETAKQLANKLKDWFIE